MIGVGPFITLPLIVAAMGGPQAMLGWILGAVLAVCDGLVWAELGAALPAAGGSYAFLRRIYPGRLGRGLSFLFLSQLLLSAPLSVASGAIGLSQYATFFAPALARPFLQMPVHVPALGPVSVAVAPVTLLAVGAVVVAAFLLFRQLPGVQRIALWLSGVVLLTIVGVIGIALVSPAAHLSRAFLLPPGAFRADRSFFAGLATAMLLATYDFWGYYNVTFLGGEVKQPERTVPRAILLSIGICAVLYVLLNLSVLTVIPAPELFSAAHPEAQRAVISRFVLEALTPLAGQSGAHAAASAITVLVIVVAFSSVFSLLLGYSRVPFAAARDGAFPEIFGRVHRSRGVPYVSLLTLAAAAGVCCFFSLAEVIAALVVLRLLLQFLLQHIGVMVLRAREPELRRPFRLWLYPVPPLLALAGFSYVLLARTRSMQELLLALSVAVLASVVYLLREKRSTTHG